MIVMVRKIRQNGKGARYSYFQFDRERKAIAATRERKREG